MADLALRDASVESIKEARDACIAALNGDKSKRDFLCSSIGIEACDPRADSRIRRMISRYSGELNRRLCDAHAREMRTQAMEARREGWDGMSALLEGVGCRAVPYPGD